MKERTLSDCPYCNAKEILLMEDGCCPNCKHQLNGIPFDSTVESNHRRAYIIGIDLGTTNSSVAVLDDEGKPKIIPNSFGSNTMPSVVKISNDGSYIVGERARQQEILNPEETVYSVKRFMGRLCNDDCTKQTKVPYKIVRGDKDDPIKLNINGRHYIPQEISAMILKDLKKVAEDYLGTTVSQAVITVPAYFNDSQRQATKDAGEIAGLHVERIVNEPTAAALAYQDIRDGKFVVLHFGGGTFDISFLDCSDNVIEVLGTYGDTFLGGDDFDNVLYEYILKEIHKKYHLDISDVQTLAYIKRVSEEAKCELSCRRETNVILHCLTNNAQNPLEIEIERNVFEELSSELFNRIRVTIQKAKADHSRLNDCENLSGVYLVGRSSLIPQYREIVEEEFGIHTKIHTDYLDAVAIGAAIWGGVLSGNLAVKDILLLDVIPMSLGIETLGGVMTKLIERNTTIPSSKKDICTTAADNQTSVDVHVLQGERVFARDNRTLGFFSLTDIPPAPRGIPQIEVTFDIDANGILNVSAKDLGTGKEQSIQVKSSSALSTKEIKTISKNLKSPPDLTSYKKVDHEEAQNERSFWRSILGKNKRV